MSDSYKIALCQMLVTDDKEQNFRRAEEAVAEAAHGGARVVCLPEIWNSPYDMKQIAAYAEPEDGPSAELMSGLAGKHGIYLVGGSIPESDSGSVDTGDTDGTDNAVCATKPLVYNTSFVFGPSGERVAKHRKVHLFDVDIEKGISFKESDFFSAGEGVTVFETPFGKMGLAVCFDIRFPEMFRGMANAGAHLIFLPASFNMTTGSAHWDLVIRNRAADNQLYVAACSTARNSSASYTSWGHSCVSNPWGEYCAATDANETIVFATIDKGYINKIRISLPIGNPCLPL